MQSAADTAAPLLKSAASKVGEVAHQAEPAIKVREQVNLKVLIFEINCNTSIPYGVRRLERQRFEK